MKENIKVQNEYFMLGVVECHTKFSELHTKMTLKKFYQNAPKTHKITQSFKKKIMHLSVCKLQEHVLFNKFKLDN